MFLLELSEKKIQEQEETIQKLSTCNVNNIQNTIPIIQTKKEANMPSNSSLKMLKQLMKISNLQQEVDNLKEENNDIKNDLKSKTEEINSV